MYQPKTVMNEKIQHIIRELILNKGSAVDTSNQHFKSFWKDVDFHCEHGRSKNITWEVDDNQKVYEARHNLFDGTFADENIDTVIQLDGVRSTDGRFENITLGIQMDMQELLEYSLNKLNN